MIDIKKIQKIHFVGIHGVGVGGLALICHGMGKEVKGSDKPRDEIYGEKNEVYQKKNIEVFSGFDATHLDWKPDAVVVGTSFSSENPELERARSQNIPIVYDSELRGLLMKGHRGIAISGVHGKTTTTALLSYIFTKADREPTYLIGTNEVPNLGTHAHFGNGDAVIIEADEYKKSFEDTTPKFLDFFPTIVITTSLEWEHVDVYRDEREMFLAFEKLVKKIPDDGYFVVCTDWPLLDELAKTISTSSETYGIAEKARWRPTNIHYEDEYQVFDLFQDGKYFDTFHILLSGAHNVLNSVACIIVSMKENIPLSILKDALKHFSGTGRRMEIQNFHDIVFIDDYAHHPTEIQATLLAVRERFPEKKIWCVFQPHMASRTYHLKEQFAKSFKNCHHLVLMDIFASAREKSDMIHSEDLLEETIRYHDDVVYVGDIKKTAEYLRFKLKSGDVLITMGAGDVYKVRDELMRK